MTYAGYMPHYILHQNSEKKIHIGCWFQVFHTVIYDSILRRVLGKKTFEP